MNSDATVSVQALRAAVAAFVAERKWEHYHTPKNLACAIASEAGELLALYRFDEGGRDNQRGGRSPEEIQAATAAELADVLLFCFALANRLDLDVTGIVRAKMATNALKYPVSA